ncbi:hypothetical protein NS206_15020, partial [Microbacterium testaceum]
GDAPFGWSLGRRVGAELRTAVRGVVGRKSVRRRAEFVAVPPGRCAEFVRATPFVRRRLRRVVAGLRVAVRGVDAEGRAPSRGVRGRRAVRLVAGAACRNRTPRGGTGPARTATPRGGTGSARTATPRGGTGPPGTRTPPGGEGGHRPPRSGPVRDGSRMPRLDASAPCGIHRPRASRTPDASAPPPSPSPCGTDSGCRASTPWHPSVPIAPRGRRC